MVFLKAASGSYGSNLKAKGGFSSAEWE